MLYAIFGYGCVSSVIHKLYKNFFGLFITLNHLGSGTTCLAGEPRILIQLKL